MTKMSRLLLVPSLLPSLLSSVLCGHISESVAFQEKIYLNPLLVSRYLPTLSTAFSSKHFTWYPGCVLVNFVHPWDNAEIVEQEAICTIGTVRWLAG